MTQRPINSLLQSGKAGKITGIVDSAGFATAEAEIAHRGRSDVFRTAKQTTGERAAQLHQCLELGKSTTSPHRGEVAHMGADASHKG